MSDHPFGWLSLLPPIVAIALAILTRRIVLSLILGVFAGALVMAGGDLSLAVFQTWEIHLWTTLVDPGKLRVFSFTILMGAMVGAITRSGGMRGLIRLVAPWARNRRRGQLATWLMGLVVFFDDYANTMLLGSTLRPICDRLKISREKLAYLVDSTAAPVAGLALVSTWVAVEIDYIASGLEATGDNSLSAFGLFLASIPYRFYIWSALLLVPITALLGRDFGPMLQAERRCLESDTPPDVADAENSDDGASGEGPLVSAWYHAIVPIAVTLLLVVYFVYTTGSRGASEAAIESAIAAAQPVAESHAEWQAASAALAETGTSNVATVRAAIEQFLNRVELTETLDFTPRLDMQDVVGAADSSLALQYGALVGVGLAVLMPWIARRLPLSDLMDGAAVGARTVLPAVAILWCASAMSRMTTDKSYQGEPSEVAYQYQDHRLYTAAYLTSMLYTSDTDASAEGTPAQQARVSAAWLPTIVFVLAAVVAFCTGTSWGTMGILVPMVVQLAHAMLSQSGAAVAANDPILLSSIAGVLAGAVFGDHCSPISDTTVLSSQSSGCDHLAHVWTQMPYALLAASISILLGTIPIGMGVPVWILLPLQLAALFISMRVLGSRVETQEMAA